MELLKAINAAASIKEDAAGGAVGATSVASSATPLFSSLVKRLQPREDAKATKVTKKRQARRLGLQEAFHTLGADPLMGGNMGASSASSSGSGSSFDSLGIVSKLKNMERREREKQQNTVTFGLEDDEGGLVRVVVKDEQAAEFEKALQRFLGHKDDEGESMEIAEILFKLKDRFDIVDVKWPDVVEDEEQEVALPPDRGGEVLPGEEGPLNDFPSASGDIGGDIGAGEGQAQSVLTQVIDMMKADADARKAEARAKEAEAKAREAQAIVQQAMAKVKQEEQYLDMDAFNKAKKDEEKEARRLAQLAKWKHDMGQAREDVYDDMGMRMPGTDQQQRAPEEEEETVLRHPSHVPAQNSRKASTIGTRVSPADVAQFILNRVKK